ncbi:hypothetical protein IFM89_027089 [Coptis chinensis]|uniref:Uncharacterized protein n=1 Tax=Coptis chinensis TaxID=261450 RepID=A0A835I4J8_9MAGN|nr:hypothetical protein IFM89_027089 [Coptis chinensis]
MAKVVTKFPLLKELELNSFSSSTKGIKEVGRCCPNLKNLRFEEHWLRGDDLAFAIAERMPQLHHLSLTNNILSNVGLQAILNGCPHLEDLDLPLCDNSILTAKLINDCAKRINSVTLPVDKIVHIPFVETNQWDRATKASFADKVRGAQPEQLNVAELPVPETKGVSGTKDDHGIFIEASATEPRDIFQDSTSELDEITQHTADIEVGETVDAFNSPTQTSGTLGPIENVRTSIVAVNTSDQVIVSESIKDQVGGTLYEGEHAGCGIRSTNDPHDLQLVVGAVNDPIASFKSPKNTFRVLNEADSLLASTCWAEMAEEAEETKRAEKEGTWRTQKNKATKSKWMEQDLSPPSTRAILASITQ